MSVISENTYRQTWSGESIPELKLFTFRLKTYTGEKNPHFGGNNGECISQPLKEDLSILVVDGDGPSLLGQDRLQTLKLDWALHHAFQ